MECMKCGTCCTAPDISALRKPLGVKCPHLGADGLCGIYVTRPSVCQNYRPDEICLQVNAPTLEERVTNYLQLFGLAEETQIGQR